MFKKMLAVLIILTVVGQLAFSSSIGDYYSVKPLTNVNITYGSGNSVSLLQGTTYTYDTLTATPLFYNNADLNAIQYFVQFNQNLFTVVYYQDILPVYGEEYEVTNSLSSSVETIVDWDISNFQTLDLTSQTTTLLEFWCNSTLTHPLYLKLVQDGTGTNLVVWPDNLQFQGGVDTVISTPQNKVDIITVLWTGSEDFTYVVLSSILAVQE